MARKFESPSKLWPGSIEVHDPLTLPMVAALDEALVSVKLDTPYMVAANRTLPAIFGCIKAWDIAGLAMDPAQFPGEPREDVAEFLSWLLDCVRPGRAEAKQELPND